MTTHELAKLLTSGPDVPVVIFDRHREAWSEVLYVGEFGVKHYITDKPNGTPVPKQGHVRSINYLNHH